MAKNLNESIMNFFIDHENKRAQRDRRRIIRKRFGKISFSKNKICRKT